MFQVIYGELRMTPSCLSDLQLALSFVAISVLSAILVPGQDLKLKTECQASTQHDSSGLHQSTIGEMAGLFFSSILLAAYSVMYNRCKSPYKIFLYRDILRLSVQLLSVGASLSNQVQVLPEFVSFSLNCYARNAPSTSYARLAPYFQADFAFQPKMSRHLPAFHRSLVPT